jgi:hypothetical protein
MADCWYNHHITFAVCQIHPELRMLEREEAITVPQAVQATIPSLA